MSTPEQSLTLDFDGIRRLIAQDMSAVNDLIRKSLHSEVALIDQLSHYIIDSGGKRLRPAVVLLAARACDYEGDQHVDLAAIVEFIHTATLLHDDVVDGSELRRGRQTANAVWGNQASVLVGDFLYSRAFQMMVGVGRMRVMEILADATNTIAEGEVMQLLNCHDADVSEEHYLNVIYCKTAKLFEAGARLGAVLADGDAALERALADYGTHLGTAFQLIDDCLDYSASPEALGKNIGDDLAEGKPTLPLIYALRRASSSQAQLLRDAVESGGREHIEAVQQAIESTEAIAYTARLARERAALAEKALESLPASASKDALSALCEFAVNRQF